MSATIKGEAALRRARVPAFAKLNLSLEVLGKRPDRYHELRTVLHTISLHDRLELTVAEAVEPRLTLAADLDIPDNLVLRAARQVLATAARPFAVDLRLEKAIPMGAGLGGGSADAAAVLLALPALTGQQLDWEPLLDLAAGLGSDVPFFLTGGAAAGLGRGTEFYPLSDTRGGYAVVVSSGIHVSTAEAYAALSDSLTSTNLSPNINGAQSVALRWEAGRWSEYCRNDFERVVFPQHPRLNKLKEKLRQEGALLALMTGSGSAVFGLFAKRRQADKAAAAFAGGESAVVVSLLSRRRYRDIWHSRLRSHIQGEEWPPQSRYAR